MTQEKKSDGPVQSPARRLGVLYVASFSVIVVTSALNQAVVLRELAAQSRATSAVGRFAGDRSFGRPLSLAALSLVAARTPAERAETAESLRQAIAACRDVAPAKTPSLDALRTTRPGGALAPAAVAAVPRAPSRRRPCRRGPAILRRGKVVG